MKNRRKKYEESNKDKNEKIKGELRKLKKEIARLRKENARLLGRDEQIKDFFEEYEQTEIEQEKILCPKCKTGNVKIIEKLRNNIDYYFCQNPNCMARGKIK